MVIFHSYVSLPEGNIDIDNCHVQFIYPLVNKQFDPETDQFIVETSLSTPMNGRVHVNLLEGTY
jgi:hypothetical protein